MKLNHLLCVMLCSSSASLFAQTFTNSSNLLPGAYTSGGVTGVTDMDNDGLDDIIIMDDSKDLRIAYQQPDGTFDVHFIASVSDEYQWGMAVADINNDGHGDVMCGGSYDKIHVVLIDGPGSFSASDPQDVLVYMQACNLADINNDGWLDGFACHDDGPSHRFRNDGSGAFVDGTDLFDYNVYPESDMSGNYGSEWSDFDRDGDIDLMVAKCRQFVNDPYDPRRTNLLFVNDGSNNYSDEAPERGLVNLEQSWTSNFADIDNDGDFDCLITTHSGTLEIHENDGLGYFTNITPGSGIEVSGFFLQGKLADFDNDGYMDIIYAGGVSGLFHNNGDHTFSAVDGAFPGNGTMHSFGLGDLNEDGWVDVYTNYGTSYVTPSSVTDRLYLNEAGSNHWIGFDLEGTVSNRSAVGALVEIHGPWGIQIREIRAGECYGITNTAHCMFGIGSNTHVDYAVIHWPAGGMQVIETPAVDMYHEYIEPDCSTPEASIAANGPVELCEGDQVTLQISNASASYLWNNGATSSSIEVTQPGAYSVYVYYPNTTCGASSNVITVVRTEQVAPTITISGVLEFCQGGSVELIASEGNSYEWSNGTGSQTASITESGSYSVLVGGICGVLESETIDVNVLPAPSPVVQDISILSGSTAEFTTTSENVLWYDTENSDTPLASGSPFVTPPITETTSFWVEEFFTYGGNMESGGKTDKEGQGLGQYHNSANFWNKFDAFTDIIINSVKVYAGNEGERTIQLVDPNLTVLEEAVVLIPEGESYVTLDFFVPEGSGYGLRMAPGNPQLWRDRNTNDPTPFDYPYLIGDLASITGTTVSGNDQDNYYYFFYDWSVQTPEVTCTSPREEVQVIVVGTEELEGVNDLSIYPNPASGRFTIRLEMMTAAACVAEIVDGSGRIVKTSQLVASPGTNLYELDVEVLASGVYQFRLILNDQAVSHQIIIR